MRAAGLDVEFTQIASPVTGRISRKLVSEGNYLTGGSGSGTLLTTIVSIDPVYFYFDVSESEFLKYQRFGSVMTQPAARISEVPVELALQDEQGFPHKGQMSFIDNRIDQNTGSLRVRAVFENPHQLFQPGLFARVRLAGSGKYKAILLPDMAVAADQSNRFVFVVADDGTVATKPVELGPMIDGLRVIRKGVSPSDTVIVNGLQRARSGIKVKPEKTVIGQSSESGGAAMKFSHTFIQRPIFASVIAIFIVIVGWLAYGRLPVAQFPDVAPPTVTVSASYPGANAQIVADTVATPIEQEINGVENMLYMSSQSTADGNVQITVTFELGTNLDHGAGVGAKPRCDCDAAPAAGSARDWRDGARSDRPTSSWSCI